MEENEFVVLNYTRPGGPAANLISPNDVRSETRPQSTSPVEFQVLSYELDPLEYREVRSDPQVAVIARSMPLRLIERVAEPEAAGEAAHVSDATWGVYVTGALHSPHAGYGVTVAVLDTGIDAGHEAFEGMTLIQKDFTGEGDGDEHGHGTHVAGTIFGRTGQGPRYAVAPGVNQALIGKVLGMESKASTKELVEALLWAADRGAHIVNMSLSFDIPALVEWWVEQGLEVDLATSRALGQYCDNMRLFDKLVDLLRARGVAQSPSPLLIAAAGNGSRRSVRPDYVIEAGPPAACNGVIAVAAVQTAGRPHDALTVASFSNIRADLAAPGVDIYSAKKGGGYQHMTGTAMASPHVAGVAALWAERQLQRGGVVNTDLLDAQLRGSASLYRMPGAAYEDVGEGLVTAPLA